MPIFLLRQAADEARSIRHLEDFRNAIMVNQFFASSPVFRSLSPESVDFLSTEVRSNILIRSLVFNQGDTGDSLYLVLRGGVTVTFTIGHQKHQSGKLLWGNFFDRQCAAHREYNASEPSVFFRISADSFWEVLVQHIDLGVFLETVSEMRLQEDLLSFPYRRQGVTQLETPDQFPQAFDALYAISC